MRKPNLIDRISLLIVGHTVLMALVIGALLFVPETSFNRKDFADLTNRARTLGESVTTCLEESEKNSSRKQSYDSECWSQDVGELGELSYQTLYQIDTTRASGLEIVAQWRTTSDDANAPIAMEPAVAATMIGADTVQFLFDDNGHLRFFVRISGKTSGKLYIYEAGAMRELPIIVGPHFRNARTLLFAAFVLIALLIALLLRRGIGRPLWRLQGALGPLTSAQAHNTTEEPDVESDSADIDTITTGYRAFVERFETQGREIALSNEELSAATHELEYARRFLSTILGNAPDPTFVVDSQGEILFCNGPGRLAFGYDETAPMPTDFSELVQVADPKSPVIPPAESSIRCERICVRRDGEAFPGALYVAPLLSKRGPATNRIVIIRDISESEGYKEMVMRLDRLSVRGQMAGDIAHEINNFLAIIQGNIELIPLLLQKGATDRVVGKLDIVKGAIDKVAAFSDGLMNMDPPESSFQHEDIGQVVHNLVAFLAPQHRFDHITFDVKLSENARVLEMDAVMIQQFFVNMFFNSAESLNGIRNDGVVRVESERDGDSIVLSISDNGPGVPEKHRASLFHDRFTTKRKGHGIGLMTCSKVISAHHGDLSYSEAPGGGAQFVARLPVSQPKTEASSTPLALTQTPSRVGVGSAL